MRKPYPSISTRKSKSLDWDGTLWAYATGIVNINTGGNYTIPEVKTWTLEQIANLLSDTSARNENGKQKSMGISKLSETIGVPERTISSYVKCLYLEPETQAMIGRVKELRHYALVHQNGWVTLFP